MVVSALWRRLCPATECFGFNVSNVGESTMPGDRCSFSMLLVREVALFQSVSGLQQLVYFKCNLNYRMVLVPWS